MERRYYKRIRTDVASSFIVKDNQPGFREFIGTLKDVSESGICITIQRGDYADIIDSIEMDSLIHFQAVDEYELFKEEHMDIFDGEVKVVRKQENGDLISFGCIIVKPTPELVEYIKNKKMSLFFKLGASTLDY